MNRKNNLIFSIVVFSFVWLLAAVGHVPAQPKDNAADFTTVLARKLARAPKTALVGGQPVRQIGISLGEICDLSDPVANRVFREYGAIFIGESNVFANFSQAMTGNQIRFLVNCVFQNETEVNLYQSNVATKTATIGGTTIELQAEAMDALLGAVEEARGKNLRITPRGGSTSARRSFRQTVDLWNSRFYPALSFHVARGRISPQEAEEAKYLPLQKQVEKVLQWEAQGYFFSKDLSKTILYSVAAPGASQHIFMLALDVEQYANKAVRDILAKHGWYQTVLSDLPHFTYLGVDESRLPQLGLEPRMAGGHRFWIPKIK